MKILVADDDRAIRTVLSQALGRSGYQVRATSSASTLWRWVEDGEGDLVITDVVMPDENGLALVPRIRRVRPELRVVVMSAQSTFITAVKAAQRGAFEYLPKPFDLKELLASSTVSQLGFLVATIGLGTEYALVGALVHVVAHALAAHVPADADADAITSAWRRYQLECATVHWHCGARC